MSEYIAKCNEVVGISGKTMIVPDYIDMTLEIVRCRDCEHYYPHGVPTCQRNRECVTGYDINGYYGEWYDGEFYVEPDGFCAWGERKEGGDD